MKRYAEYSDGKSFEQLCEHIKEHALWVKVENNVITGEMEDKGSYGVPKYYQKIVAKILFHDTDWVNPDAMYTVLWQVSDGKELPFSVHELADYMNEYRNKLKGE